MIFLADEHTLTKGIERLVSAIAALFIAIVSRKTRRPFITLLVVGFICYQVLLEFMANHIASALMVFPVALVVTLTLFRPTEKRHLAMAMGAVVSAGVIGYCSQYIILNSPDYFSLGLVSVNNLHFDFFSCLLVGLYALYYYTQTLNHYYALVQTAFDQHQQAQFKLAKDSQLRALANVSHELRNPINGVLGSVDILANRRITDIERTRYVDILKNCSNQLRLVINDVLDFTKLDSGEHIDLIKAPANINQTFADVLHILLPSIKDKKIKLEYQALDTPQWALIDNIRLQQIVLNLLSNAFKFTESGGRIKIKISLDSKDIGKDGTNAQLNFSISDTGKGISKDRLSEIFIPFRQLNGEQDNKVHGTGLGLPITKSLVELMGGHLDVTSREHQGTEVQVTIPVEHVTAPNLANIGAANNLDLQAETDDIEHTATTQKLIVLIADDDYANRHILAGLLQRKGVRILSAENGRVALELAMVERPDFIILDMQMPEMDGIEAAKNILAQLDYEPTIIGLSGNTLAQHHEQCLAAGMKELLTKPIDVSRLEYWMNYVSCNQGSRANTSQPAE